MATYNERKLQVICNELESSLEAHLEGREEADAAPPELTGELEFSDEDFIDEDRWEEGYDYDSDLEDTC